jgi:hypothetical protein
MDSLFSLIIFFSRPFMSGPTKQFCFSYLLLLLIIKQLFFKSIIFQKFGTNYLKLVFNFFYENIFKIILLSLRNSLNRIFFTRNYNKKINFT